ncbi:hypothetical protein GYA93_04840 [Gordonia desulfuricans]|uniref:Uncharacterized protein n=1 Tax=Gordonia desulfuricans TaxID=89051 RepID=A0A7K3LMZ4_9ACTN|nr:hypothetical protein [Gordonia desulfuricans]NDK88907.1 hypothetical protein [Gordonia desulfuricans]
MSTDGPIVTIPAGRGRAADAAAASMIDRVNRLIGVQLADCGPLPADPGSVIVTGTSDMEVDGVVDACRRLAPQVSFTGFDERPHTPGSAVALLVVDPSSDVGAEEQALLSGLRTRVGTVALVCTRIDAFWEWPRILRSHRAVLDPASELPVFAVSVAAADAGADDESGIADLVDWLVETTSAPPRARAERARTGICLGELDRALADVVAADRAAGAETSATEDPGAQGLAAVRQHLVATRDRGRNDRLGAIRAGLAGVRASALADVAVGVRSVGAIATARCARPGCRPDEHAHRLDAEIAALGARIDGIVTDRLEEVAAVALLGVEGADPTMPEPDTPAEQVRRPLPTGRRGAEDALVVLIGASTGLGVGRLAVAPMASVQTLQWISMPLTLALGVAAAIWVIRVRRATVRRSDLRGWSLEVLADTRGRLEHRIAMRVADAESRLAGQIGRHHDRRVRQVAEQVTEIDRRLRELRGSAAREHKARTEYARQVRDLRAEVAGRAEEMWARRGREHRDGQQGDLRRGDGECRDGSVHVG